MINNFINIFYEFLNFYTGTFILCNVFVFFSYISFFFFLFYLYLFEKEVFKKIFHILNINEIKNFFTFSIFLLRLTILSRYYLYNLIFFKKLDNNIIRVVSFITLFMIFRYYKVSLLFFILYFVHCVDILIFHLFLKRVLSSFEKKYNLSQTSDLEEIFFGDFYSCFKKLYFNFLVFFLVILFHSLELSISVNESSELFRIQSSILIDKKIILTTEEIDLLISYNEMVTKGVLTKILEIIFPN